MRIGTHDWNELPVQGASFCFDPRKPLTLRSDVAPGDSVCFAVAMLSLERLSADNVTNLHWDTSFFREITGIPVPPDVRQNVLPQHNHNGKLCLSRSAREKHNVEGLVLWTRVIPNRGMGYGEACQRLDCVSHGVVLLQRRALLVECMAGQLL